MAIEALNSAMTYQAQTTQTKPAQQTTKPAAEYTDVSAPESIQIDKKINIVEGGEGKENPSGNDGREQQSQPNSEQIRKAVEKINKQMSHSEAIFGIHDRTNRLTIKIIDKETKEIIKELPPEKTLDMIAKVWELAGILIDEKR